jgi:hypothetical protein
LTSIRSQLITTYCAVTGLLDDETPAGRMNMVLRGRGG